MRGIEVGVRIGADKQQVPQIRLGQRVLEQVECGRVEPLQIVEEQGQRMFRPREHANELPEYPLETSLGRLWREFGDRRLFSDDKAQFRDKVDHEAPVRNQRLQKRV